MFDLIQKALSAHRESKCVEFKQGFDPNSPEEWCEVVKDIVAIANSGGGIIVFGLDNLGGPTGSNLDPLAQVDPADVSNKIAKYTGPVEFEFEIRELKKQGQALIAFLIKDAPIPIVFQKPGTFDIGGGRQRTAFSVGTVYFRHGAKSEPGTSGDIRRVIERRLEFIRRSWVKNVRRVVHAPLGAQVVAVQPGGGKRVPPARAVTVRAVNDPRATPVLLTRNLNLASGSFVHEEVSEGIFDEINNVIDANRILARGQQRFFLGQPVYYKVYAERQHVSQREDDLLLLLHSAVSDFYAPAIFWILKLPDELAAQAFSRMYLYPKTPHIYSLVRLSVLLGKEFSGWLYEKWHRKWIRHPQPPSFFWSFKGMISRIGAVEPRIIAARTTPTSQFSFPGAPPVGVQELMEKPERAASLTSKACMKVFEGDSAMRSIARDLDYFAYGPSLVERTRELTRAIRKAIGDQEAGDVVESNVCERIE
jgi:hypothetical protein